MISKKIKFYSFFFAGIFLFCGIIFAEEKSPEQKTNSFAWAISSGLQNIGVTVSVDKVEAYLGTAFGPNLSKKILCLSDAIQADNEKTFTNILLGIGLKEKHILIGKRVWSKAVAREFIRTKIRYALAETNIVLMQGGWQKPSGKMEWGIIDSIDFNGLLKGHTQFGESVQKSYPQKIVMLSVADTSLSHDIFRDKVLKNAINQLDNSILLQNSSQELLTGCNLIDYIVDLAHRSPFCPNCKQKDYVCMYKILREFFDDFGAGVRYLNLIAKQSPSYEKKEIMNAAEQLAKSRELINPFLDINKLKVIMSDREMQAGLGETIRKMKINLTGAAKSLAIACNEEIEPQVVVPETADWSAEREERKLVRSLPLFTRLYGLDNTFFISATMASEILGEKKPVEWLLGVSGYPFKFLIKSNSFSYVSDAATGYDCMGRYLIAAGLVPTFYTFGNEMSINAGNMIRKEIVRSIDKMAPSIISVPKTSNEWGIITGYKDSGQSFLCRLPSDSNYFFSVISTIPEITITLRKSRKKQSMHSQVKAAIKQLILLHGQTNFTEYLSGISAVDFWLDKCKYYSTNNFAPPLNFAKQNQMLWLALRDNLRNSYRFLEIAMTAAPELVVPLSKARDDYVNAVNLLNLTYADGFVLRENGKIAYPVDWRGQKSVKQIQALEKVKNIITQANLDLKIALRQLQN